MMRRKQPLIFASNAQTSQVNKWLLCKAQLPLEKDLRKRLSNLLKGTNVFESNEIGNDKTLSHLDKNQSMMIGDHLSVF